MIECKHEVYVIKQSGPHYGQYCIKCGAWITWMNKKQAIRLLSIQKELGMD